MHLDTLQPSSQGLIRLAPSPWKEGQTLLYVLPCPPSANQTAGRVEVGARQSVGQQQGAQHAGRMVGAAGRERAGSCGVLDMGFQQPPTYIHTAKAFSPSSEVGGKGRGGEGSL